MADRVVFWPLGGKHGTGRFVLVDELDRDLLDAHRWHLAMVGYARAYINGSHEYLHRLILRRILGRSLVAGEETDHISGDRLDNRRANLRVATHAENAQNQRYPAGSSAHRGVYWHAGAGKWAAHAAPDGRTQHLGLFDDEDDAAEVARQFRSEHMEFAND